MSIRTRQEQFHCGKCKVMLILIAYDMVCPNCNWQFKELSKDDELFKTNVIGNLRYHKHCNGSYVPGGMYIGSQGDLMMSLAYQFVDLLNKEKPQDRQAFLENSVKEIKLSDKKEDLYLRQHYHDAFKSILDEFDGMEVEEYLEKKYGPEQKPSWSLSKRFKRWISS
jgi:hypothetical protein